MSNVTHLFHYLHEHDPLVQAKRRHPAGKHRKVPHPRTGVMIPLVAAETLALLRANNPRPTR